MEFEINFEHKEEIYTSVYRITEHDLTVYRTVHSESAVRGRDPEQAAMTHMRAYGLHLAAQGIL